MGRIHPETGSDGWLPPTAFPLQQAAGHCKVGGTCKNLVALKQQQALVHRRQPCFSQNLAGLFFFFPDRTFTGSTEQRLSRRRRTGPSSADPDPRRGIRAAIDRGLHSRADVSSLWFTLVSAARREPSESLSGLQKARDKKKRKKNKKEITPTTPRTKHRPFPAVAGGVRNTERGPTRKKNIAALRRMAKM